MNGKIHILAIALPLAGLACSSGPGSATTCAIAAPQATIAGQPLALQVSMRDSKGQVATSYLGTLAFSSTDPKAAFGDGGSFTAADKGLKSVGAELGTASTTAATITATDSANPSITCSASIVVSPGPASTFALTLAPNVNAGNPATLTIAPMDEQGNVAAGYNGTVTFSSTDSKASLPAPVVFAGESTKTVSATLLSLGSQTVTATAGGLSKTAATIVHGLTYANPTGGVLQLVADASSTPGTVVLKLVPTASVTGSSAGFNLPLDASKVALDPAAPIAAGTALKLGAGAPAVKAAIPAAGPLAGTLVAGVAQKGYDAGAVVADSTIAPTGSLLSVKLKLTSAATPGVVFDGAALGSAFNAGLRDRAGNELVHTAQVAVGRLVVQ